MENADKNSQPAAAVVVVGGPPPPPAVSLVEAIILSCVVFWFCGWLFGGIAYILAVIGQSSAAAGDSRGAILLRNASYGLSIIGIVFGFVLIAVVVGVNASTPK